jgi:hypothetical protein
MNEIDSFFDDVKEKLYKAGVPKKRMPTKRHIISLLQKWMNNSRVEQYVKQYAESVKEK